MELYYYKPTKHNYDEFKTYEAEWHPMADSPTEWIKKEIPKHLVAPARSVKGEHEEAEAWFKISNLEDLEMLEREKDAFMSFYNKEQKDILRHI